MSADGIKLLMVIELNRQEPGAVVVVVGGGVWCFFFTAMNVGTPTNCWVVRLSRETCFIIVSYRFKPMLLEVGKRSWEKSSISFCVY